MRDLPVSTDQDLWVSWAQYHRLIETLAQQVYASGWRFDHVLCLARGGLRVGDTLSRIFEVPLAILSTSSYRAEAGTVRGELDIAQHITSTKTPLAGKVLLVDDLVDSGITLEQVQQHLPQRYTSVEEIKTAVIWWKACSRFKPDFHVDYLPTDPWIHQPFEEYDTVRPEHLQARLQAPE